MPVMDEAATLRHHTWRDNIDGREMRPCTHCGGLGQVPRDGESSTPFRVLVCGFAIAGVVMAVLAFV